MNDPILFPDAVEVVVSWLTAQLPVYAESVHVGNRVPNPRPVRLVRVRRLGGSTATIVSDSAQVAVEVWAATAAAAHDLCQKCRALVHAMASESIGGVQCYRVDELGGPVELPDPDSDYPRYTFQVLVQLRGTVMQPTS